MAYLSKYPNKKIPSDLTNGSLRFVRFLWRNKKATNWNTLGGSFFFVETAACQKSRIGFIIFLWSALGRPEETTLERADFSLQLFMFVTAEKEEQMFLILFLFSLRQLLSLWVYKIRQAKRVQNQPA